MGHDELSFQPPELSAAADLSIPEATFHLRVSRDAWAACSVLTPRTVIADTSTVRLLREISPPHDFAVAADGLHSVPLGYAPGDRVVESFREFLSHRQPDERWGCLIVFEPLGFLIYGRWTADEGELLVQDARGPLVNTVFGFPRTRVADWLDALGRLAATLSGAGGEEVR